MQPMNFAISALWAEGAAGGGGFGGGGMSLMLTLWLPLLVLFYFLMIRPQKKERNQRAAMLAALQKNDRVVTVGGVYGVVANVRPEIDEVTLKVDETTNTKIRVTLSSIHRVLGDAPGDTPPAK